MPELNQYAVVWTDVFGRRLIPVDEKFYKSSEAEAKEAAREMLVGLKATSLSPVAVVKMDSEEQVYAIIASDRQIEEIGEEPNSYEFVVMVP